MCKENKVDGKINSLFEENAYTAYGGLGENTCTFINLLEFIDISNP